MTETKKQPDLTSQIAENLPYLRRYARALTGSQRTGDNYAAATIEAILEDRNVVRADLSLRTALFRAFHQIWTSSGAPVVDTREMDSPEARAQWRLAGLSKNTREALLLHSIEGFGIAQIAGILDCTQEEAASLLSIARDEMSRTILGQIMIIEDEAIIAADIRAIVESMGHKVTGIARTRTEAVLLARKDPPDMILADIQLADKSSGIEAVNTILAEQEAMPVVFITAFPERLLTGRPTEPAFLITKPYTEEQILSAVSQAMFFSGTDTLGV